jgi:hypothetical protein
MAMVAGVQGNDARRIRVTLWTIVVVAGGLALVEGAIAVRDGSSGLWILCAATALFTASMLPALGINRRGHPGQAVFTACVAILGIQTVYVLVFPRAYSALAIASVVTVALALTYVHGTRLRAIVVASWAVASLAVVVGVLGHGLLPVPASADAPIQLGAGLAAVAVGMVLLWEFARHMESALTDAHNANDQLRAAHDDCTNRSAPRAPSSTKRRTN